ncbi:sulfatase [soil metagenome]
MAFPRTTSNQRQKEGQAVCKRCALRWMMAGLIAEALACLAVGRAWADEPATTPKNVLFIAIDDLNDWTGFLGGHPQAKTPNLDRLAAQGVVFERAYCSAPACNPSRASLLTGLHPTSTGVYLNSQPWRPVLPEAVTLPQYFQAAGYDVRGGGKIFHGRYLDPDSWDEWFPLASATRPEPDDRPVNGIANTGHFDWGPLDVPDAEMPDAKVVSWAIDRLNKSEGDKPFFLAVGLYRPHLPWYVPRPYFDQHPVSEVTLPEVLDNDLEDLPPAGIAMAKPNGDHRKVIEARQWEKAVQGYLASIAFADAQIGRLLDALEASPHAGETVIVLWGDHGWHLGEKQHWRKFALWEEATRVPLVVNVPGVTQPGGRSQRTVTLLDLYPTLIELAGLPPKQDLEGKSFVPLLRDPGAAWDRPAVTTHGRGNHAVRSERWRFIRYANGDEELYDHEADPQEWKNLADDPRYSSVKQELAGWLPKREAPNAPRETGDDGGIH